MNILKQLRKQKRLTQIDVAKQIYCCRTLYTRFESGSWKVRPEYVERLSKVLDIEEEQLKFNLMREGKLQQAS